MIVYFSVSREIVAPLARNIIPNAYGVEMPIVFADRQNERKKRGTRASTAGAFNTNDTFGSSSTRFINDNKCLARLAA